MLKSFGRYTPARVLSITVVVGAVSVLADGSTISARSASAKPAPAASTVRGAARDGSETSHVFESGSIDPKLLSLAFGAANCAIRSGAVSDPSTLTVIDYSKASTAKRFWVYDMHTRALLYEELVAHGQGSGENFPTLFSNDADTHRSSLGLFVTEDTYIGKNGYSLRLNGLDAGFNDHARERAIVMHGAPYVSAAFAQKQGRLGRSWGCPALDETVAREVIDRVRGGSLVFAYYPDQRWLNSSQYLRGCANAA